MTDHPQRPRKLTRGDDTTQFVSGADELDEWLTKYAWENLRANNAVTYVSTIERRVVGYYALAVGGIELAQVPQALKKGTRPDPLPVLVLARLAVDQSVSGVGLGAGLLRDALERSAQLSESIGAAALLVHARDEAAKEFYLHNGDFAVSPITDLQLMVSMKTLRATFLG